MFLNSRQKHSRCLPVLHCTLCWAVRVDANMRIALPDSSVDLHVGRLFELAHKGIMMTSHLKALTLSFECRITEEHGRLWLIFTVLCCGIGLYKIHYVCKEQYTSTTCSLDVICFRKTYPRARTNTHTHTNMRTHRHTPSSYTHSNIFHDDWTFANISWWGTEQLLPYVFLEGPVACRNFFAIMLLLALLNGICERVQWDLTARCTCSPLRPAMVIQLITTA